MISEKKYQPASQPLTQALELVLLKALEGLRYGSVEIIIHDSKVVQIERKEKFRLPDEGLRTRPS
jgi:hypothetical protein